MTASTDWLTDRLPPTQSTRVWCEADFYGASSLIADALGMRRPRMSLGTWMHGTRLYRLHSARQVIEDAAGPWPHLVATRREADVLTDAGCADVHTVGFPIVYAEEAAGPVERRPGTLLVMPAHGTHAIRLDDQRHAYLDTIADLRSRFDQVIGCVTAHCIANGDWIEDFDRIGVPWILGATVDDRNALVRMQRIFRSVEAITTNTLGSHLVYGAYCGCRVSITGSLYEFRREDFADDPVRQRFPELIRYFETDCRESVVREDYPMLWGEPDTIEPQLEWGRERVGLQYRRAPDEIARLLGWRWPQRLTRRIAWHYHGMRRRLGCGPLPLQ